MSKNEIKFWQRAIILYFEPKRISYVYRDESNGIRKSNVKRNIRSSKLLRTYNLSSSRKIYKYLTDFYYQTLPTCFANIWDDLRIKLIKFTPVSCTNYYESVHELHEWRYLGIKIYTWWWQHIRMITILQLWIYYALHP